MVLGFPVFPTVYNVVSELNRLMIFSFVAGLCLANKRCGKINCLLKLLTRLCDISTVGSFHLFRGQQIERRAGMRLRYPPNKRTARHRSRRNVLRNG